MARMGIAWRFFNTRFPVQAIALQPGMDAIVFTRLEADGWRTLQVLLITRTHYYIKCTV